MFLFSLELIILNKKACNDVLGGFSGFDSNQSILLLQYSSSSTAYLYAISVNEGKLLYASNNSLVMENTEYIPSYSTFYGLGLRPAGYRK